jgi:hypothetical protein
MFLVGWGTIAMAATANTLIQLRVPDELRGRVMSVYTTAFAGSTPVGGIFTGVVASVGGAALAASLGGILAVLVAALVFIRLPARPELRSLPPMLARRYGRHR